VSDHDDIRAGFREAVNLTPGELSRWLESDQSTSVAVTPGGQQKSSSGGAESVGHSGETIAAILRKKETDLNDDDVAHLRKSSAV
jgi:hypothetical protein